MAPDLGCFPLTSFGWLHRRQWAPWNVLPWHLTGGCPLTGPLSGTGFPPESYSMISASHGKALSPGSTQGAVLQLFQVRLRQMRANSRPFGGETEKPAVVIARWLICRLPRLVLETPVSFVLSLRAPPSTFPRCAHTCSTRACSLPHTCPPGVL